MGSSKDLDTAKADFKAAWERLLARTSETSCQPVLMTSIENMRASLLFAAGITLLVCGLGFYFDVSGGEWVALVLSMAMVWMAEGMNTAIETLTDLVSPQHHPLAGKAKDIAAGGVLIAAIGAAIVGSVVFYPHFKILLME